MNILHIAKISDNKALGVDVVVPQHVLSQSDYENVAFINLRSAKIETLEKLQIEYCDIKKVPMCLPVPFNKPDLVVFHEVNNIENIYVYKNLVKNNIPFIIIPHGELTTVALRKKYLKKKLAYFLLFNKFIKSSLALQCLSKEEMNNVKFKKFKFIGTNGIYNNILKKQNYEVKDSFKMLYLGRLEMNIKGLDRIIDAMSAIAQYCRDNRIELSIYGPNVLDRRVILQKYIEEKKVDDLIKIYDPIFDAVKHDVMINSDLFVQTSRSEGMPVGILEAMNLGLPCLLTKGTRLVEISEKYGACFYAGETVDDISQAIIAAFKSDDRKVIAQNAINMTLCEFDWKIVSKNNLDMYKKILKGDC